MKPAEIAITIVYMPDVSITRNSKEFRELVSRLQAGTLTRAQAAAEYGINPGTLGVWLSRSKVRSPKALHGAALGWAITDPDKIKLLNEAVAKVLAGEVSATKASEMYPTLALATIAFRVRKARIAAGQPVQHRRTREELADK
ncbi:MAG: hypothetical protein Q7U28_09235 [Aquabacterium sp.]|nr:hypothetical protein [Aquabacterium sp.]